MQFEALILPQLHCTLMNTTFRKPRGKTFSFTSALEGLTRQPSLVGMSTQTATAAEIEQGADFGAWGVGEVHLYRMGSWDKDGRYVSVGHISLTP